MVIAYAAATGAVVAARPAHAAGSLVRCWDTPYKFLASDSHALCAQVIRVSKGSYLNIRKGPHMSSPSIGKRAPGAWVEVDGCWTYGDGAPDDPTYTVWDRVYWGAGTPAYVSDWYLNSGNVRAQLKHC